MMKGELMNGVLEDAAIIGLYLARSEDAISESEKKYHLLLTKVILSFLNNISDAEECENDTYLSAWNQIPPDHPHYLGAYLSKIARCLAISRFRKNKAEKRNDSKTEELTSELMDCVPSGNSTEKRYEEQELRTFLNTFIGHLEEPSRYVFLRRYFYGDQISDIAKSTGFSEGKIKSMLFRTRKALKKELEKEGYDEI